MAKTRLAPRRLVPLVATALVVSLQAQDVPVIGPPPGSSSNLDALESRVAQNPDDLKAREQLLVLYNLMRTAAGQDDPARRSARLQNILYLVQQHPEAKVSGSGEAYVCRRECAYANAQDHDLVRDEWLRAVEDHPQDNAVILNGVKFLEEEDQNDAEEVLQHAAAADPDN